jgi:hypothetical protein
MPFMINGEKNYSIFSIKNWLANNCQPFLFQAKVKRRALIEADELVLISVRLFSRKDAMKSSWAGNTSY